MLRNAVLIDGEGVASGQAVRIRGDRIEEILPDQDFSGAANVIDLENRYLSPGLIDLQLNGCGDGGLAVSQPAPGALKPLKR